MSTEETGDTDDNLKWKRISGPPGPTCATGMPGTPAPPFPWKRASAVVAVLLVGVFMAGRYSRPARVVTSEKLVEVRHEQSVVQQKVDLSELKQLLKDQSRHSNVVTTREIIRNVDGSSKEVVRKEDKSVIDSHSSSTSVVAIKKESTETKKTDSTKSVEKTSDTTYAGTPKWSLGLSADVSVPALFGSDVPSFVPGLPKPLSVGLQLDRKIIGPVFVGVRANSRAEFGVVLGIRR